MISTRLTTAPRPIPYLIPQSTAFRPKERNWFHVKPEYLFGYLRAGRREGEFQDRQQLPCGESHKSSLKYYVYLCRTAPWWSGWIYTRGIRGASSIALLHPFCHGLLAGCGLSHRSDWFGRTRQRPPQPFAARFPPAVHRRALASVLRPSASGTRPRRLYTHQRIRHRAQRHPQSRACLLHRMPRPHGHRRHRISLLPLRALLGSCSRPPVARSRPQGHRPLCSYFEIGSERVASPPYPTPSTPSTQYHRATPIVKRQVFLSSRKSLSGLWAACASFQALMA